MARRRKRKFNPSPAATTLIALGTAVVGGVGAFVLASYGCGKMLKSLQDQGYLNLPPGPVGS